MAEPAASAKIMTLTPHEFAAQTNGHVLLFSSSTDIPHIGLPEVNVGWFTVPRKLLSLPVDKGTSRWIVFNAKHVSWLNSVVKCRIFRQ